jgi:MFS family permease
MINNKIKILIFTQSIVFFASSLIFPFYILFLKNVGSSFSLFGLSYGIFGLSSAVVYLLLGRFSSQIESYYLLVWNCFGMSVVLLSFPHITTIYQVFGIQLLLGMFGALQKHGEKMLLAYYTDETNRGVKIGSYHFWTTVFSSIAIICAGFLADYFTINFIFYFSSLLYFCSGIILYVKSQK